MKKLCLVLIVLGTCLIPPPPVSDAAIIPCSRVCCTASIHPTATTRCTDLSGNWMTCGDYWQSSVCP